MVPIRATNLIKPVSEQLNISEEMLEDMVTFYYNSLRKSLSGLVDLKIDVPGLGHFMIRQTKVKSAIKKTNQNIEGLDPGSFSSYHYKKLQEEKLRLLNSINNKISEFLIERKKFRDEQIKYHLEKEKTNSRGNN
jgi:nucleoid DNA-binding protein